MATIYSDTLVDATSSTSGVLDVSAYSRLWVALNVTAVDWTGSATFTLSRLDAFDTLFPLVRSQPAEGMISLEIGAGLATALVFGDRVQLDVSTFEETSVSATISIIGE